ncbi:MAG: FkbM family methyltransferase [Chloroflexota bacterium]
MLEKLRSQAKQIIPASVRSRLKTIQNKIKYPYITTLGDEPFAGSRFEISGPTEEFRILHYGDERQFSQMILDAIEPRDVFFDIGSCVGILAIPASLHQAQVFGFEPDPMYRQRIQRNIELNDIKSGIQILDWAVSDQSGTAKLYTDGIEGLSASLQAAGGRGYVQVETNSIDQAIASNILPPPDIIKLDIEGAEILALRGMRNLLHSHDAPRMIFCEFHQSFLAEFDATEEDCIQILLDAGYERTYWEPRNDQSHGVFAKNIHETTE